MDIINDLTGEEIVGTFCKKELQKINQREFRTEKVIRKKSNKLYVNPNLSGLFRGLF